MTTIRERAERDRANGYKDLPALLAALDRLVEAAEDLPGHHYESGRLDQLGEPGEPICGECDNDWPCPNERLRGEIEEARKVSDGRPAASPETFTGQMT